MTELHAIEPILKQERQLEDDRFYPQSSILSYKKHYNHEQQKTDNL